MAPGTAVGMYLQQQLVAKHRFYRLLKKSCFKCGCLFPSLISPFALSFPSSLSAMQWYINVVPLSLCLCFVSLRLFGSYAFASEPIPKPIPRYYYVRTPRKILVVRTCFSVAPISTISFFLIYIYVILFLLIPRTTYIHGYPVPRYHARTNNANGNLWACMLSCASEPGSYVDDKVNLLSGVVCECLDFFFSAGPHHLSGSLRAAYCHCCCSVKEGGRTLVKDYWVFRPCFFAREVLQQQCYNSSASEGITKDNTVTDIYCVKTSCNTLFTGHLSGTVFNTGFCSY